MKKVLLFLVVALLGISTASAQFEKGNKTIAARTSALDLEFGKDRVNLNLSGYGSYFIIDNLALKGGLGLNYQKNGDVDISGFDFEVGANYYFYKMFYGGLGFALDKYSDVDLKTSIKFEAGATCYIAKNVFVNPAIYYKSGLGNTGYSQFGLEVGIGVNF